MGVAPTAISGTKPALKLLRVIRRNGVLKWGPTGSPVSSWPMTFGAASEIAAQALSIVVIIGYVMPFFGLELLGMSRDAAAFNLPARVGCLSGSSCVADAGSANLLGHSLDRRRVASLGLAIMIRPGLAERERGFEVIPQPGAALSSAAACARGRRQRTTAPLERRSLALSPPLDRNDRLPHRSLRRSTLQSAFGPGNEVHRGLVLSQTG
jgi:hypothetical protein